MYDYFIIDCFTILNKRGQTVWYVEIDNGKNIFYHKITDTSIIFIKNEFISKDTVQLMDNINKEKFYLKKYESVL